MRKRCSPLEAWALQNQAEPGGRGSLRYPLYMISEGAEGKRGGSYPESCFLLSGIGGYFGIFGAYKKGHDTNKTNPLKGGLFVIFERL